MSVAVVTTCYNQAEFIQQNIESVLDQTVASQHIIVNDGSTDGSQTEIDRWKHITSLEITNRGMPAARNAGLLSLAPGVEWVVFLDGDDWFEPNFIEECLEHSTEAEVIFTKRLRIGHGSGLVFPAILHPTEEQLWQKCHAHSCAMIARRVLVRAGGFHSSMSGYCDWDFWIDCVRRGVRFAYCEHTFYSHRIHAHSFSITDGPRMNDELLAEMRRHHNA